MLKQIKYGLMIGLFGLGLLPLHGQLRTPEFKVHDRGNLWETMKDDGTIGAISPTNRYEFYPSMDWPGGPHILTDKDDQRSYMVGAGMWIGWKNSSGSVVFSENGPLSPVNEGQFEPIVEIENFIESTDYDPALPEETIIAEWTTKENIHVKRTSKVWSLPEFNNFIIIDYEVTNNTGSKINDVYIGFPYLIRPSYQDMIVHNGWGDELSREDESVNYDSTRALLYAYDNYMADYTQYMWDWGNYWNEAMEIRTPGYAGFALLGADPASDGKEQPANVFWGSLIGNSLKYTLTGMSGPQDLYAILNGSDKSLQADPETHITPIMLMSCGPYTIDPLSSVQITLVEAVDGLPLEDVIDIEDNTEAISAAQAKLSQGLGMLQTVVDNAKELYNDGCRLTAVPPPSPEIEIIPLPSSQRMSITWEPYDASYTDPITEINDFKEYSVYRSDRSFIGPYKKIKRYIRPSRDSDVDRYFNTETGRWQYEDTDIKLGVSYYYAVTATDNDGNESWFTNRNEEAVLAASFPDSTTLNVKVFPNPFREQSGFPARADANSIVWTSLPVKCTIRIYTVAGELVRKLEHDNPNSGEEIWDQLTNARQRTAAGVYFWTVDSDVGTAKGSLILIK